MTIGLFTTTEDPIIWLTIKGSMQAAKVLGSSIIIYGGATKKGFSELNAEGIRRLFCFNLARHSGLIAAFAEKPLQEYFSELNAAGHPVMLIARAHGSVPHATTNNHETICRAVKSLAEKEHRQIAFLAGPQANFSADERLTGYRQGLEEAGLPFSEELVFQGDYSERRAYEIVAAALKKGVSFSALLCANDLSAIGAMTALRERELVPGADVEVVGFDNIARGRWTQPPLSSFDPQLYRTGYQACEELLKSIRGEPFEPDIRIPARFVPRASTWESGPGDSPERPLMKEWTSHRFDCDAELAILRSDEEIETLLEELRISTETPESFAQCFRVLLDEVCRRGFSALCLTPILMEIEEELSQKHHHFHAEGLITKAYGLQTIAVLDEQRRKTELAHHYTFCTTQLRELPFSIAKEAQVLSVFRNTLIELRISHAGVYLYDRPSRKGEPASPVGFWHAWPLTDTVESPMPPPVAAQGFDSAWLEHDRSAGCWLALPLLYGDELLGLVALAADSEHITSYSDLIRLFTFALSSARLNEALAKANAELVETSRLAGLAEMATGILHNIGNALNSVNTSCSIALDAVRKSKASGVARAAQLLTEQGANAGHFLENDPRGQKFPAYLTQLGEHLQGEQSQLLKELEELRDKVDHINQIVANQQSYAQVSGLIENIDPAELVEFALKLSEASLTRHKVNAVRNYDKVPPVQVQRQKAVQILVNIIRNAKESMGAAGRTDKILNLRLRCPSPGKVIISITDNGKGIPPDDLSRIFSFGFTTKPGGHGYGLHNSALAAREMKGNLSVESEGLDKGASFHLELPAGNQA